MRPRKSMAIVGTVWLAVWTLAGCASPDPKPPLPLQSAPPFSASGTAVLPDLWWTAFEDAELDGRVERALASNFSLTAAWERLRAARALTRRTRSDLYPRLNGVADGELRDGSDVEEKSAVSVGLEASYEVDLWGRIRSTVEADRLRADATEADYRTAAISLSAEMALTWYRLAEARQQQELLDSQLATNETALQIISNRFAVGQSGSADVLRLRALSQATREQAIVVRSRIEALEHQLAVLEGIPPQADIDSRAARLPDLPPPPATGLPAELLGRRPDVLSAFLRLEAADADVAAAVKDQYPRVTLAGTLARLGENPADFLEEWFASIAGSIVAPLIDAGQRRAEVERNVAVRRQRLAEYGQTVLFAFQEVEDALALSDYQVQRIDNLESQLSLTRDTYRQLRSQYIYGAVDYLDVLSALRDQQSLERNLLSARLQLVELRIALYRALAGGFETPREQSRSESDDGPDESSEGVDTVE
ncbi:MAG: efflux transporter outer membrane subunit [Planctomycetota bacterium]